MKHLDLFSGIGGFALSAAWAGFETIAFCETDKFCQKVLKKHWPDVPIHGRIQDLDGTKLSADIITGGFPCQPFSVAGKRKGKEDDRAIWPQMFRIIQEVRPAWVLGENVVGIIGMELDNVLSDLAGAGYETQAFIIPACAVDAPHRRDRIWIVANAQGRENFRRNGRGLDKADAGREGVNAATGLGGENVSDPTCDRTQGRSRIKNGGAELGGHGDPRTVANTKFRRSQNSGSKRTVRKNCKGEEGTEYVEGRGRKENDVAHAENTNGRGASEKEHKGRRHQKIGRCSFPRSGIPNWSVEPNVGRVAARLSSVLDGTIRRYGYDNANDKKAIAAVDEFRKSILCEMWCEINKVEPSPYREKSGFNNRSMYEVSCLRTHEKWNLGQRIEKEKVLCNMWKRICAMPFKKTQNLRQKMLERIREAERNEKVASSRVDRLKGLGNAIVPQVAYQIMMAIKTAQAGIPG